jgi:hypothetical protein
MTTAWRGIIAPASVLMPLWEMSSGARTSAPAAAAALITISP